MTPTPYLVVYFILALYGLLALVLGLGAVVTYRAVRAISQNRRYRPWRSA